MRYIYALRDPATGLAYYIGTTRGGIRERLAEHITDARHGDERPVCVWIRQLQTDGAEPIIGCIDDGDDASELWWIDHMCSRGEAVCNVLGVGPRAGRTARAHLTEPRRVTLTVRVRQATKAKIEREANRTGRSQGEVMDELIRGE